MFLASTQPQQSAFVDHHASLPRTSGLQLGSPSPEAPTSTLLTSGSKSSMERSAPEYSQSDHASAAQFSSGQEARSANYTTSATPSSEYSVYPHSARSSSFPDHLQRAYHHPSSNHSGGSGDPSIAAPSPTYGHGQYSPYGAPQQDNMQNYPSSAGLYAPARPDWANYGHPGHMHQHSPAGVYPGTPTSAAPPGRPAQYGPQQVYSFVPIPGAQQHKRPRRRYEEIERMYKCGWNGCEKAYGTLNHLNAHVTMQSHGQKRTPEEFKEIRKEWKARKKEEDQQRKASEEAERQRHAQAAAAAAAAHGHTNGQGQDGSDGGAPTQPYSGGRLPPMSYPGNQYPAPPSGGQPIGYSPTNNMPYPGAPGYQPQSPYEASGQQQQQVYSGRQ